MATDKRARKKQARDEANAARLAEFRRRRIVRLLGVGAVAAAIVVWALMSGGNGDAPEPADDDAVTATEPAGEPPGEEVACDAEAPPEANPQQYEEPPPLTLERGVDYRAVIHTSCGDITIDLREETEATVASFVFLAREGYYDGQLWHRVENNFVIQTGDPNGLNGTPPDGPGYTVPDEFPEKSNEYIYGTLGLANAGPGTGGSQFFIIVHDREGGEPAGLQPVYTIFGEVDPDSYDVIDTIARLEVRGGNDPAEAVKPIANVYIESIEILES